MSTNDPSFLLFAAAAVLFGLHLTKPASSTSAPSGVNTPNANNNSERKRDLEQAANGGYASPAPFVIDESVGIDPKLRDLLNPAGWNWEM